MRNLTIDGNRLWQSMMTMAAIGATEKGGVCRLTLTDLDRESRDLFAEWCEASGCSVEVDAMGNMFARRPGRDNSLPPIVAGSHLDSQPTGGKYDGAYGVLAALEIIRTLNDNDVETDAPIEIAMWTNEEGSRFAPACMGSATFAGAFTLDYAHSRTDPDGKTVGEELARIGYLGKGCGERPVGAYFEAHIEQGPILEAEEKTIGVVTGAQAQRWYEINLIGMEAHAGPTPMARRKDALLGAAKLVQRVNEIGHRFQPDACATVGVLEVFPASRNVIPGRVFFTVDFRHPDAETLAEMDAALREAGAEIAENGGLEIDLDQIWSCEATEFEGSCVEAVRDGAEMAGLKHRDIISGAGHDAMYVAQIAPAAMIFVPCKDGISHNELESATPEDLSAGCQVLLNAILEKAGAR
ncbi:MAG TPA: Zn-dependent hydrolase [Rhodospirillaceae bacterium]|nr:Zn-dependent hydrolase [Rhodospirillaceae bacterium]HAA91952.1 Zn-dependent hydrolase [Rhodospirillaceae bacterium]HAT34649.1 Zn-dependent hydrolase [Rhodospirillaceae bacterium]